jgi:glycosyltransferase involved in cell wall biosynthesis
MSNIKPKITIGMPVYNGEEFVRKKLQNIMSQTFVDFELIISDDSTDSTSLICKEFIDKDKRIRYVKYEKRNGWAWSAKNLIKQATGRYFVLTSVDDIWSKDFLKKNIEILDSNKKFVGSISKITRLGQVDEFQESSNDSQIGKTYKKFRRSFRPFGTYELVGSFENKAGKYLRKMSPLSIYAIFRTKEFQKGLILKSDTAWEWTIFLNVLKYGDFHVRTDDVLGYYLGGSTSKGLIDVFRQKQISFKDIFFPHFEITKWCLHNIGLKFFIKNLDHFTWLNFYTAIGLILEITRKNK